MVLSGVPREISPVTPPGIDPGTVRLVAQVKSTYFIVLFTYLVLIRPDDGRMPAETCCLKC